MSVCAFLSSVGGELLSFHCWHYPEMEVAGPYVICMINHDRRSRLYSATEMRESFFAGTFDTDMNTVI